jgi:hypothetical protein
MSRSQTITLLLFLLLITITSSSCGKKVVEEIKLKHTKEQSLHSDDPIDTNNSGSIKTEENDSLNKGSSGEKELSSVTVKSSSASNFIGKNVTIKGYVADVHITKKVAYLNFDNKYPNHTFTGVIFARSFPVFDDIEMYEGKTVEITGEVSEYKGKPQIILENKNQIKISAK